MNVIGETQLIHKGAKFDFERITFEGDGGRIVTREIVRHPGAVVVLPLLAEGPSTRIVMIRNTRAAIGKELWELPAGTLEPPEPPDRCAARELEEETGYRAGTVEPLGRFYTTPGMTDELMHAFVARGLEPVAQRLEADERIRVEIVSVAGALRMIESGELLDAKSILALLLAQRRGLLPQ